MQLFQTIVTEERFYYLWKGEEVTCQTRNSFPWHDHMYAISKLQKQKDNLVAIRMKAIEKFFSNKDASYACIYKHYKEMLRW